MPHLLVCVGFAGFVVYNGSVVVGDRENHIPQPHFAQLGYLVTVMGVYLLPDAVQALCGWLAPIPIVWESILVGQQLKRQLFTAKVAIAALAVLPVCAATAYLVHIGTVVHPFLLADNRHYTFYIWSKLLGRSPRLRLGLSVVYVALGVLVVTRLASDAEQLFFAPPKARQRQQSHAVAGVSWEAWLWAWGWLAASAAAVVPSPLLEFRYFIVPVILALVHVHQVGIGTFHEYLNMNASVKSFATCRFHASHSLY
jgi:alpha-1,2-glucosyltransferase